MDAAAYNAGATLEFLSPVTTIDIQQTSAGGYYGCSYTVLSGDEILLNLVEDTSSYGCCGGGGRYRQFQMDAVDISGKKVFSLLRQVQCMSDKLELYINDALTSVIRPERTCLTPILSINDAQDCPTLRLKGKRCEATQFKTATKIDIGTLDKKWLGWRREMSLKNNFIITVPADLAVQFKAAVIAACVFIDFNFFEGK